MGSREIISSSHVPPWITWLLICLWMSAGLSSAQQQEISAFPQITDVSAMCTEEGITAQIMFDGNFHGLIYSHRYSNVHDCIYYNTYDMSMILFTIPNYKCGTRLTRNQDNVVNHIENEVYVQFDKDTQNADDRRYLFICDLSPSIDFSGTVNPSQTIIVQTIEPTRILITQEGGYVSPNVFMQIKDGEGPFQNPVNRPLKLGDPLTLTVTGRGLAVGSDYNMFVHNCYAADGGGEQKVLLIDRSGCSMRPRVAGEMKRIQSSGDVVYYFRLTAFKFPGSVDVYFSCSVDICRQCNFATICPGGRTRRNVAANASSLPLIDQGPSVAVNEIQIHDYVQMENDEVAGLRASRQPFCFTSLAMVCLMATFGCTLLALIGMTVFVISIIHRRRKAERSAESRRILRHWRGVWNYPPRPDSDSTTTSTRVSSIS